MIAGLVLLGGIEVLERVDSLGWIMPRTFPPRPYFCHMSCVSGFCGEVSDSLQGYTMTRKSLRSAHCCTISD